MAEMFKDALKGIRIADFSWVWAGPYATSLLSYLGAEVIKIESRGRVDQTRKGSIMNGDSFNGYDSSPTFNNANLNKQSVAIDITKPEGAELARKLVAKCDIVVANMRPGKMDKLGLGYKDLVKVKPDIIMMESSGFGSTGPYKGFAGFAPIFASFGGLAYLTGYEDGTPNVMSGVQDMRAGTASAFILITALINRKKTGKGTYIDISSSECLSDLVGPQLMDYTMNGRSPFRCGNQDDIMAPHNVYRAKGEDSWVSIAVGNDAEWKALKGAMGDPEWAQDEKYDDELGRWQNRKELDQHMTEWTKERTSRETMELLQKAGVAAIPSFSAKEILDDPHTKARDLFQTIDTPALGQQVVMRPAWKLSETPARIRKAGPLLGADNHDVFENLLGMTKEEVDRLEEEQIAW